MWRTCGLLISLAVTLVGCGGASGDAAGGGMGSGAAGGGTVGVAVVGPRPSTYGGGRSVAIEGFLFVVNPGSDSISEYSIDPGNGTLLPLGPPVATGRGPTSLAIVGTSDRKYLYVSNSGSNDISAFALGPKGSALAPVAGSPFAAGTNPNAVAAYTASFSSSRGGGGGPISYRWFLGVTNTGADSVDLYSIDPGSGVLATLPARYATGTAPTAVAARSDGQFLYVANSGGSHDISAYLIDGYYGSLRPVLGSPFPSGGSASALAFGAGEVFLYDVNASGRTAGIMGFRIHPFSTDVDSGALAALPGFPHALPSCTEIVTDQSGAFLYATAASNVFGFSIDRQTGALSPLPGSPFAVAGTADSMSIDPTNQFIYVTSSSAGKIAGFRLNAASGELTTIPGSPFAPTP